MRGQSGITDTPKCLENGFGPGEGSVSQQQQKWPEANQEMDGEMKTNSK